MRRLALTAVPAALLLAACGGGQDIAVTNDNNVVLNDAHANTTFTNDGEMPANDPAMANGMEPMNTADPMMGNTAMPVANAM